MYRKATFVSMRNDFRIYLSVCYSKTTSLIKNYSNIVNKAVGLFPGSLKACLNKCSEGAVVQ